MSDEDPAPKLSQGQLFSIFFKAGLAFGGGLGILSVMEEEFVTRRRLLTRDEFLSTYAIGRIVPSGTMTALAVAYGYRFGGMLGTMAALTGLGLPAFALTILLTAAYAYIETGPLLPIVEVSVLPAAVALIVVAALRLGRDVFTLSPALVLAAAAFAAAFIFKLNPALLLLLGGVVGIALFRQQVTPTEVDAGDSAKGLAEGTGEGSVK